MTSQTLNLFPVRAPIGRITGADGKTYDVLMTQEFARALAALLVRVGGPSGMDSEDILALASADTDGAQVGALRAEVEELRATVSALQGAASALRQIEELRRQVALIEDPAQLLRWILTRYAPLNSPTFTGIPKAPTAERDTNTDQLASTKFVLQQASDANPVTNGVAAPGASTRFARADHVHPTDTSKQATITPGNVTGSRAGNTTVTLSLLSALAGSGLINDTTTP